MQRVVISSHFALSRGRVRVSLVRVSLLRAVHVLAGASQASLLVLTCLLALARTGRAQAGGNDPTFNVLDNGIGGDGAMGAVAAIVVQPDGRTLIAGSFTRYNQTSRNRIARLDAGGLVDSSFDPGAGANSPAWGLARRPDGRVLVVGAFTSFDGVSRPRIAGLNPDGSLDASFDPGAGANATVKSIVLQPDGKALIAGAFTTFNGVARSRIARLDADGSLDPSFEPGTGVGPDPHGSIVELQALALQPDGRVVIVGEFTTYAGTARSRIARLNADGSLDPSFDPGLGASGAVNAVVIQPDGRLLIVGEFTSYDGVNRHRIARLNSDGSVDPSFDPGAGVGGAPVIVAQQLDGKVLVGGAFSSYDGATRINAARLNPDGSLDPTFDVGTGPIDSISPSVRAFALQSDGRLLIGGWFTSVNGTARVGVARLFADGSVDTGFNPGAGASQGLLVVTLQPDEKVLIGGWFTSFNGEPRRHIARLNADGSLDTSFHPGTGASFAGLGAPYVTTLAVQPDGKVLVGGRFTSFDGVDRGRVARLNSDGSLDSSFGSGVGADDTVWCSIVQPDGKLLVAGNFATYDGVSRNLIARLNSDGSLDASFSPGLGAIGVIRALVRQPDGKYLIGGGFTPHTAPGQRMIARLNSDGSVDTSFLPGSGLSGGIRAIALQPDGKVLVGGTFAYYNGEERVRIARVNSNGIVDLGFDPVHGATGTVDAIVLQPDGKLLIGGQFAHYDGYEVNQIARVHAHGGIDTTFTSGSGASGFVYALSRRPDGRLLIGGTFTSYDGATRHRIARVFTSAPGFAESYCTSGMSAMGCSPTMSALGVASASATSGFVVRASNIEGQRQTNTFYGVFGPRTPPTPFGAGFLCVRTPTQRMSTVPASGTPGVCDGSVSIDVLAWAQAHPAAQGVPYAFGTTLNFQCAIRDPQSPGARVMSDALQVTLLP